MHTKAVQKKNFFGAFFSVDVSFQNTLLKNIFSANYNMRVKYSSEQ